MLYYTERKVLERHMKSQLPEVINKNDLVDWIIKKQRNGRMYCSGITVNELVKAAERCGIKVIKK